MHQILLQPGNPDDFEPEDFQELIDALRKLDQGYEVRLAYNEQIGHRVTWAEAITLWLSIAADAITIMAIVGQGIAWAQAGFEKEKKEQVQQAIESGEAMPDVRYRPKYITIYGPDGNVLKSVVKRNPDQ